MKRERYDYPSGYKLTPELTKKFAKHLRAGHYLNHAAKLCGVDERTAYRWIKKGRAQRKGPFRDFVNAVDLASGQIADDYLALIKKHAVTEYQAAIFFLERRFPREWGKRSAERNESERNMQKLLLVAAEYMPRTSYRDLVKALELAHNVLLAEDEDSGEDESGESSDPPVRPH